MASIAHYPAALTASDLLRSSSGGFSSIPPLRTLGTSQFGGSTSRTRHFSIVARIRKPRKREYPWPRDPDPNIKGGVLRHLSPFKPLTVKPKPVILEFEKPLLDLEKQIKDVKEMAGETGLDFTDQIVMLENKYQEARRNLYTRLTPIQRVYIARHPHRPTFLDHVFNMTEKFVELHGDRAGYDDPAIVTGIGTIDGKRYMFIGHQKGRNTKESIKRNFGMPTPHGYRKALRMMHYADHHGFPIITMVDTPGAFADLKSEELNQGEAIAQNLRTMFGLKVPIVSIVIGEGGSGGALAIACANYMLMLENAVFYVASPEACAAILYKSSKEAPKAARRLKITARELCGMKIADGVIPEPLGGAHVDPEWTSEQLKKAINKAMTELNKMDTQKLLKHRSLKFRKIGKIEENAPKHIPRKKKVKLGSKTRVTELGDDVKNLKQKLSKWGKSSNVPRLIPAISSATQKKVTEVRKLPVNEMITKVKQEVDSELSKAVRIASVKDKISVLRDEIRKAEAENQLTDPKVMSKIGKLKRELSQKLSAAPNYKNLKSKVDKLNELTRVKNLSEERKKNAQIVKQNLNEMMKKIMDRPERKEKIEKLKAEIQKLRASGIENADQKTKDRIAEMKMEIDRELANDLKSLGFNTEVVKKPSSNEPINESAVPEVYEKVKTLEEATKKKIEGAVQSPEIKKLIELLRSGLKKLRSRPDPATARKVEILQEVIKKKMAKAVDSPDLKEKHVQLNGEVSIKFVGGSDGIVIETVDQNMNGSLNNATPSHEDTRVEVNSLAN
ncbi:Acetyl-coenzyme A carboxylase carboxyl transferase subunit alpha, chloroplastic [Linum perenne]